jgi:hypothetical protein
MMSGIFLLIKGNTSFLLRPSLLETVMGLLAASAMHPEAARYAFDCVAIIASDFPIAPSAEDAISTSTLITAENFAEYVDLLISFAAAARSPGGGLADGASRAKRAQAVQASIERALRAIELLYRLHARIPGLVDSARARGRCWYEFWLPILSGLGQQCVHPCKDVRMHAMTHLQRALLSPELGRGTGAEAVGECFEHVLFPLADELLQPETAAAEMDETRMRAVALLSKIFLHHVGRLPPKELGALWGDVLDKLLRYLGTEGTDFLVRALSCARGRRN